MAWQRSRVRVPLAPPGRRSRRHDIGSSYPRRSLRRRRIDLRPRSAARPTAFGIGTVNRTHRVRRWEVTPSGEMTPISGRPHTMFLPAPPDHVRHCPPRKRAHIPSQTAPARRFFRFEACCNSAITRSSGGGLTRLAACKLIDRCAHLMTRFQRARAALDIRARLGRSHRPLQRGSQLPRYFKKSQRYSRAGPCRDERGPTRSDSSRCGPTTPGNARHIRKCSPRVSL